jgi:LysM repeat protein
MPAPPRLLVAAGAVLLAAAILFFVPALLLKPGGGSAATASPSAAASGSGAVSAAPSTPAPTPTPPKQTVYTVRQGDTLLRIATRFGVTVEALRAANKNIKDPNKIAIGDKIIIPSAAPSEIIDGGPTSTP